MNKTILLAFLLVLSLFACGHERVNPCDPRSDNYNFDVATFQKYSDMAWVKIFRKGIPVDS